MGIHDRIRRLERGGAWFGTGPPAHGIGVPREVVEEEFRRTFGGLPGAVAREAQHIRERRAAGEPLDDVLGADPDSDNAVGLMGLVASYGSWEAVPETVMDALEASAGNTTERAGAYDIPEDRGAELVHKFQRNIIGRAFALLKE